MTDVDIKIENIVASASIGKDIVLTEVSQALEGVNFNREQFPGLVFKLKDPKTAALIFSSGKLVCTGAKSIDDSKIAIKKTVDLMRTVDTDIPEEFEIKIQNIIYQMAKVNGFTAGGACPLTVYVFVFIAVKFRQHCIGGVEKGLELIFNQVFENVFLFAVALGRPFNLYFPMLAV